MASSSSSTRQWQYDVFLSFRGSDTRDGFVSHLFDALCRNNIITFLDENLDRGEEISDALLQTIEESCVSLVIFSENYAFSPWCLDELEKIFHCKKVRGQVVLPIFYRIDPTDVQELTGIYGDAFIKHKEEFKDSLDKVENWSNALNEIAGLSGFVSQNIRPESKLVENVVNQIFEVLRRAVPSDPCDDGLVGMESHTKHFESLFQFESADFRFLGIWGMAGVGKTTLALKIYDKFCSKFEGHCFIENVREKLEKGTLQGLQLELLSKVFVREISNVGIPVMLCSSIRNWIGRKKVLIVLDDVSDLMQIEFLVGSSAIYTPGSRIIMTCRDKQILRNVGAEIYEVKQLNDYDSLNLFRLHAFKQNPPMEAYVELERKVVQYAQGIPLAVKVLGSNLYGRSVEEWDDELEKLKNIPDRKIEKILRLSFDGLDGDEKEIFLDIACFFNLEYKDHVENVLKSCGFSARIGISNLLDKSLITISGGRLVMHDLIRQIGHDIVRKQGIRNAGERSRLWIAKDIYHVLKRDKGTCSVECISLNVTQIRDIELSCTAFQKMNKLRFLDFYSPYYLKGPSYYHYQGYTRRDPVDVKVNVHLPKAGLSFLPDELRYLYWYKYPAKSLPLSFCPYNLVELHLIYSHVEELYFEDECLGNLKVMDLSFSVDLLKIPDLYELPKLEVLCLAGCSSLVAIRSSIKYHNNLSHLNLRNCKNLSSFPRFINLGNLDFLCLEGCLKIKEFPEVPDKVKEIILSGTAIQEVTSSIGRPSLLTRLELRFCTKLKSIPSSISELKCLKNLDLRGCSELMNLPDDICNLKSLEFLDITHCVNVRQFPDNLGNLESLVVLFLRESGIKNIPFSINSLGRLRELWCDGCDGLILPSFTAGLSSLQQLGLADCGLVEISSTIGTLLSLAKLYLGRNNMKRLPTTIKNLSNLCLLNVTHCKKLEFLPDLPPSLKNLDVYSCTSLKSMSKTLAKVKMDNLWWLDVSNGVNMDPNECKNFANDFLVRLESTWQELSFRLDKHLDYDVKTPHIGFCVAGNQMPHKLMYKNNSGSSLVFSLGPRPYEFVVLVFCAVVAPRVHHYLYDVFVKCRFTTESGDTLTFESGCPWHIGSSRGPKHRKSMDGNDEILREQTYFWVSAVQLTNYEEKFNEVLLEFYPSDKKSRRSSEVVIKCGAHMFCGNDDDNSLSFNEIARPICCGNNDNFCGNNDDNFCGNNDDNSLSFNEIARPSQIIWYPSFWVQKMSKHHPVQANDQRHK